MRRRPRKRGRLPIQDLDPICHIGGAGQRELGLGPLCHGCPAPWFHPMPGFLKRIGRQGYALALGPVQPVPIDDYAIGPKPAKSGTNNAHFIIFVTRTRGRGQNCNGPMRRMRHIDQRPKCLARPYLNHDAVFRGKSRRNRIGKAHRMAQMAHPVIGGDYITLLRPITAQR